MLKTGEVLVGPRLMWKNIGIHQPFYFEGCYGFGIKTSDDTWVDIDFSFLGDRVLGPSCIGGFGSDRGTWSPHINIGFKFYRLPKDIEDAIRPL